MIKIIASVLLSILFNFASAETAQTISGNNKVLHIIVFGAHPDDCDMRAGGTAALYTQLGHKVKFVSLTNGDKGHQSMGGAQLVSRRLAEAKEAGRRLGIEYEVLDNHDGELMPTLENRMEVIRLIREWDADVVITSRPNDYHPDHRNTGLLVQDAAYLVIVPNILSTVPALKKNPLFLYTRDDFRRPNPFRPDVVIDISGVFEKKVWEMDAHVSQYYEWLPWTENELTLVPKDTAARRKWLAENISENLSPEKFASLEKWYGKEKASGISKIESFEICEYGLHPTDADIRRLFPMLPQAANGLSQQKQSQGWISLFDGKSLKGWHRFNAATPIDNWTVIEGALVCLGAVKDVDYGGDIVTDSVFKNFELEWDWKLDEGSNSGLMYHVQEGAIFKAPYETGPEYQLIDDVAYDKEGISKNQQAGADYGMYAPGENKTLMPVGSWNHSRLIYKNGLVEHWLNGKKIVEFVQGSADWKNRKKSGKWKDYASYGNSQTGRICLQDHGRKAYFKNIFIKVL